MDRTRVGSVEVITLVDNVQAYPGPAVYPGADEALSEFAKYLDANGNVVLNFACFLLIDGDRRILVDTGWGPEQGGKLPDELRAAGIGPETIDTVVFTHLHGDHTGWNFDRATGKPLFANARYLVPRGDWEHYASASPVPESFERDVRPLERAGVLELIEGERALTSSISTVPTPGHTPGHTSLAIVSGGEHGFILGDVVLSPIDTERPELKNGFDWNHDMARETRLRTLERLERENALVGASHLPPPGLGRFVRAEGRRVWVALNA